ncbi:MAG: DUF3160 domain-containing protein [Planctomycetota bacterium]
MSDAELSGFLDGELSPEEEERVIARLALDAGAPRELAELSALQELVRDVVPLPDAARWASFDAGLAKELDTEAVPDAPRGLRWWGHALVAASVLCAAWGLARWLGGEPRWVLAAPRIPDAPRDYRAPSWTPSEPRPLPPLDGLLEQPLELEPGQIAALGSHGLIQLGPPRPSLSALYGPEATLPPLASADTSLVIYGAVASRLALELEQRVVRPEVRGLVDLLDRELGRLARDVRGQTSRHAVRAAQEYVSVLAALEGLPSQLADPARRRVHSEVALIRAAVGPAPSPVLSALCGREVVLDYGALRERGLFSHATGLDDHGRAMRWLSVAGLPLDPDDPAASRAACMLVLALSQGRLADGRYGFGALARLEAALEVLYGRTDAVTPFELLEALRRVLSQQSVTPSELSDAVVARVASTARALTPAPVLGAPAPGELEGVHLLGRLRSLEGQALARLGPGRVAGRERASALDVLGVLADPVAGRRLRSVISAEGSDGPDPEAYDAAVAALREQARPWWDPSRPVPTRACLEQGRLWTVAALLRRRGLAPIATLNDPWYRDRLALTAFAALNATPPAPADLGPIDDVGPIPVLEPLPELHARIAFSAARLRDVGEQLLGWGSPAVAALDHLTRLEAALSSAAQDVLSDRPVPASTLQALAQYVPTVRALAPLDVRSVEDLGSGVGGVLHRGVLGVERLVCVGVDPSTRRLEVAQGAALVASSWWGEAPAGEAPVDVALPRWPSHRWDEGR